MRGNNVSILTQSSVWYETQRLSWKWDRPLFLYAVGEEDVGERAAVLRAPGVVELHERVQQNRGMREHAVRDEKRVQEVDT